MKKIDKIKKDLRVGDQKLCAEVTGYCEDYVKMVVAERRFNKTIIHVLSEIVQNRKQLIKALKSFNYKTQK